MNDDLRQNPPRRAVARYQLDCLRCGEKSTANTYALLKRLVRFHVCKRRHNGEHRGVKPGAQ